MGGTFSHTPKHVQVYAEGQRNAQSSGQPLLDPDQAALQMISVVMPIFYTKSEVTSEEMEEALRLWILIKNSKAPRFQQLKSSDPNFPHQLCTDYFYHTFYTRLFDVHPGCRGLFHKSINKQGSFFLGYFQMLMKELEENEEKFRKDLLHLASTHNKYGIKAIEYTIAGEVLLYTLRACVGDEEFTPLAQRGWAKFYSRMLDVIMPAVVSFELKNSEYVEALREARVTKDNSKVALFKEHTNE